ncbi:MAG: lysyl oxidase family protein [Actinomycetota bacterium]|nr:lysyl oxidase family protein [Actinomycetota bacterium]
MRKTILLLASVALAVLLAGGVALLSTTEATAAKPKPLYPNLKTLKPTRLTFGTYPIGGTRHYILRFTNTVWNAGQGPLEVRGKIVRTPSGKKKTKAVQRIYNRKGDYETTKPVGTFVYHPSHNHMHFGDFSEYQLWRRADYDKWVRMGRDEQERVEKEGAKNGVCMLDTRKVKDLRGTPERKVYRFCTTRRQGLSVGFGDTYNYRLPDQWVDLGTAPLKDGDYVLRSVADPKNILYESPNRRYEWRESRIKNAALTYFTVEGGTITVTAL